MSLNGFFQGKHHPAPAVYGHGSRYRGHCCCGGGYRGCHCRCGGYGDYLWAHSLARGRAAVVDLGTFIAVGFVVVAAGFIVVAAGFIVVAAGFIAVAAGSVVVAVGFVILAAGLSSLPLLLLLLVVVSSGRSKQRW